MRLKHIEVFNAIMVGGSVSAAARLLHVTQPAVTQSLAHAELQLGQKILANQGLRVVSDLRNEKVGYKIREHTLQRVPYLLVAGDREREQGLIAVRSRSGEDLGTMTPEAFAQRLRDETAAGA